MSSSSTPDDPEKLPENPQSLIGFDDEGAIPQPGEMADEDPFGGPDSDNANPFSDSAPAAKEANPFEDGAAAPKEDNPFETGSSNNTGSKSEVEDDPFK